MVANNDRPKCCECGAILVNWPDGVPAKNVRCKSCVLKANPEAYGGVMMHAEPAIVMCETLG